VFLVYLVGLVGLVCLGPDKLAETIDGLTDKKSFNERDICTKFITPAVEHT
jgi:hypothetical protein